MQRKNKLKQRYQKQPNQSRNSIRQASTNHSRRRSGTIVRAATEISETSYAVNLLNNQTIKQRLKSQIRSQETLNAMLIHAGIPRNSRLNYHDIENSFEAMCRVNQQKTSYNKSKPLMFLRPYSRYLKRQSSLEQVKADIYEKVSKAPKLVNKSSLIEYYTEYGLDIPKEPAEGSVKIRKRSVCSALVKQKLQEKRKHLRIRTEAPTPSNKMYSVCNLNNFITLL